MSHLSTMTHCCVECQLRSLTKTQLPLDPRSIKAENCRRRGDTMRHVAIVVVLFGCTDLGLDPQAKLIHARFDPDARVIPMPTDVLRDAVAHRLEMPNDTAEERAK